jgi:release factor glutamine methyltransferase
MTFELANLQLKYQLEILYEKRESSKIADMVMEYITGIQRVDRIVQKDKKLSHEQRKQLDLKTNRLLNCEPVQYVLGEAWFANKPFQVNASVLIPRPETEELVDWIIQDNTEKEFKELLDIGTGSGCIPITLKKMIPNASVMSIDISSEALTIALNNAIDHEVNIDLKQIDFLDESNWYDLPYFDCIVSNPPYIKDSERSSMSKHVIKYEPSIALFVSDDDPLIFYRKIALLGNMHLSKNGIIYLEINQNHGKEVVSLFQEHGYQTILRKDMMGNDRMVKAEKLTN